MTQQEREIPGLAIIVKVVGKGCNLNCQYCFYSEDERKQVDTMTDETLHLITREGVAATSRYTGFYWHGGEPLIPGIKFYERIIALQKQYHQPDKEVENMIQTNGTLITPEWAQFFKDNNFQVGLSLDGTPEFHDALRKDWAGKGSYRKILQGIETLQKAGIRFGVIVVLTSLTNRPEAIRRIIEHLNSIGIKGFGFNYCHEVDVHLQLTPLSISTNSFVRSILEAFETWLELDDANLRIREVDEHLALLFGRKPLSGRSIGKCGSFITIDAKGDVYPCDCFYQAPNACLGNLNEDTLAGILHNRKWQQWQEDVFGKLYPECPSCEWFSVCRGGCAHERFFYDKMRGNRTEFCGLRKGLFTGMLEKLQILQQRKQF